MQFEHEKPERILRASEVCRRAGFGKSTLYTMLNAGEFPAGVRVTKRNVGWRESEVEAWIKSRPAASSDVRERDLTAA
jgi:prophage regulatory protein